jgi:hypothetical protein
MLVFAAAVSVASVNTGCRSGGWNMPGLSGLSWSKKRPPVSSIAGTREPTQPPSISVPPYPPEDSSSSSASATALASYPGASSDIGTTAGAGPNVTYPGGPDAAPASAAGPGFATGPYSTNGSATAMNQTQQGFYRTSTPQGGSPAASTADARNGYPSGGAYSPNAGYGAESVPQPNGYAGTSPYGNPGFEAAAAPTGGNYAPVTTPGIAPESPDFGYAASADNSYSNAGAGDLYPSTAAGAYPVTNAGTSGSYPVPPGTPGSYGATPYPIAPSSYGGAMPTYGNASPYGAYGTNASAGSAYGTDTSPTTSGASSYGEGYRPGSTSRNGGLLGPDQSSQGTAPSGGTTFPSTYR